MATRHQSLDDVLYPPLAAAKTGMLQVSELHTVYWEESGKPDGLPVMVLHGGPGGGSQDDYRRYFDPAAYRIVQVEEYSCVTIIFIPITRLRWTSEGAASPRHTPS